MGAPAREMAEISVEIPAVRWRNWILAAVFALLLHALFLFPKIPGLFTPHALVPPRVDIKQVDPRKLEAIRQKWREQEKQLLLNKDKVAPDATEADPNAKYMSDRNIRVEKEQRAKNGEIAKRGAPGAPTAEAPRAQPEPPKAETPIQKLPKIGSLGVPLPAAPKMPKASKPPRQTPAMRSGQNGAEQAIQDPNLPVGSENMLNAQESVYYSFYARLYEAIGPLWQSKIRSTSRRLRINRGDYSTQLDVVFDRAGNLVAINQQSGSGVEDFDKAAFSAWRAVGRFPNPPAGLLDEDGQVHTGWTFTVQVDQGLNLDYLPPERVY